MTTNLDFQEVTWESPNRKASLLHLHNKILVLAVGWEVGGSAQEETPKALGRTLVVWLVCMYRGRGDG